MNKYSTAVLSNTEIYEKEDNLQRSESSQECNIIWKKFLDLLSDSLKKSEISTWFSVITPKSYINNVLTIELPSKDYYSIIEKRFNKQIVNVIESGLLGENGKLIYEIREDNYDVQNEISLPAGKPKAQILDINSRVTANIKVNEPEEFVSNLYSKFTFENFVKGDSNELATATAYAIANNPGRLYNPFFVYGGVGIGKTHLIQSIGNEVLKNFPDKKVYYTTAPDFTTQFTSSIAKDRVELTPGTLGTKKLDAFYKSLDVLIIDDIQNLAGKPGTQDFMYQIFNTLYNNKKHIIFSCDKPINQIKDIEERLISRFKCGMIADIQLPSWEMRVAIIKRKFSENNISVPEEVIHFIATNIKDSIRTIEGCIVGMIAESALIYKGNINQEIAEKVISRIAGSVRRTKNISIENIIYAVGQYFNVSENNILSKKRTKEIAFARQVAMYLAKELTNSTLESIGLNFGGKDHSTVLYAFNCIKSNLKKDDTLKYQIEEIKQKLKLL